MKITHAEWMSELVERFGESPAGWAFRCPNCGDIATGADFRAALAERAAAAGGHGALAHRDGSPVTASDRLGQECIGRILGALAAKDQKVWDRRRQAGEVRGCDWAAYGLFHGPVTVVLSDGREMHAFPMASK